MLEYFLNLFNSNIEPDDLSKQHVYVNVYDMIKPNYITQFGYYAMGVGVFHSGVEIGNKEYCFGGHEVPNVTGVFAIEPRVGIPELTLKQTIDMGITDLSDKEIGDLLLRLSDEFTGPSYNLLSRNCNHFTEEFVKSLNDKSIPTWINRAARLGNMFPCVVPWEWIQPPELQEEEEEQAEEIAEEEENGNGSLIGHRSRRSSTISLLSNSKHARSSYNSTLEGRSSSQERLIGNNHHHYQPISKFQGILMSDDGEDDQ